MPFILALLGIIVTAYFWANRARNAGNVARDIVDMAGDVRLAARRFGFTRKANVHPVESIEDPDIAAASLAHAFVALDEMPSKDQQQIMLIQLRSVLRVDQETAQELLVLGTWLVNECGGPMPAITRIAKKLYRLQGASALEPVTEILTGIKKAEGEAMSQRQEEALSEIRTILRVR
ncbi:hypothetical protein SAMN04488515_1591 [Cognatiyoonia koreensis]|uniref:Tellurite resistance protein TerB n=1 Tax=Cognatiyoonia koreensis TaxID=364200 RepID=A0A1I0Q1J7_9RHOB|nr:hypothetical protein [Cognatiyoonia koreensis]SEW20651.1 hypothetical protein SAMN04488515_1591 [Cognatiyoonia koreensis]